MCVCPSSRESKSTIGLYGDCHSGLIHVTLIYKALWTPLGYHKKYILTLSLPLWIQISLEKGQVLNGIQIHSQNDHHTMFNELYMSVTEDFNQDENQCEFKNSQCSEDLVRTFLFSNLPSFIIYSFWYS